MRLVHMTQGRLAWFNPRHEIASRRIEDAGHGARYAGDLGERLDHDIARHTEPILRAGAQSVSGVKSSPTRSAAAARCRHRRAPRQPAALDRGGAFRRRGHAAKGDARRGNAATVDTDPERSEHGGDVLVEPFADLEGLEIAWPAAASGRSARADEFARRAILFAVADEEVLERQRAHSNRPCGVRRCRRAR